MNKKLYAMMDWAAIEEIVYGECARPDDILGARTRGLQTLVQAYFPGAARVSLLIDGGDGAKGRRVKESIAMECADGAGFFAALLPGAGRKDYRYSVEYDISTDAEGKKKKKKETIVREWPEIYGFGRILGEDDEKRFLDDTDSRAYSYMGAIKKTVRGVRGVVFRVWAPQALRVSLIGEFNDWDAKLHPMNRLEDSGIFELFMPAVEEGAQYAFDVLMKGGVSIRKADPYSRLLHAPDAYESIVCNASHKWKDDKWMRDRAKFKPAASFMNIYILAPERLGGGFFKDGKAMKELAEYIAGMGYTHVQMRPLCEYPKDADAGYHPLLYFAPSARFGEPADIMSFVDILHAAGLGLLLEWAMADFSNAQYGLASFDGSPLYEYADPRRGTDPRSGFLMFDLGKAQVKSYMLSALRYWMEAYHVDGFVLLECAGLLFLDYYRQPGEWVANIYGGVENLESIAFFKEMNGLFHKEKTGLCFIAANAGTFPKVTEASEEGLGFDLVTDGECMRELTDYLSRDPIVRKNYHSHLTGSMLYQYCENYLLPIGLELVNYRQGGLRGRMHGDEAAQWKQLKLLYGWQCLHNGKMSSFMGQEYGEKRSYEDMPAALPCAQKELEAEVLRSYLKSLYKLCREDPAYYACDDDPEGFVWLLENAAEDNVLAFAKRQPQKDHAYICVFNFANAKREKYFIPVEQEGKYKLIFSTESAGEVDGATTAARRISNADARLCIRTALPALSLQIWQYIAFSAEEKAEIKRREEEREKKRRAEEEARKKLAEERARLRKGLKDELAKKIAAAEAAIAAGSENKSKTKRR